MKKLVYISLLFTLFISACRREEDEVYSDHYDLEIPQGFPIPNIPADNYLSKSRVEMGKRLFFDTRLSVDNTISCASCHLPQLAFSDDKALSFGVTGHIGKRNAPPLQNLAWVAPFMRDGGVPTLELQVHAPLTDTNEMAFDILLAVERLKDDPYYRDQSLYAYKRAFDAYVITRALAAFERTLVSGNSKYDQYLYAGRILTASELRGKDLFFSDSLHCSDCHSGYNFSNNQFENNGLYVVYPDTGRARITLRPEDSGKFRVPSLRNVEVTAPYMFDGSLASLGDVIDHYAAGGAGNHNQSPLVTGFLLSQQDKDDLIAFLKTLTDTDFLNNPAHRP